MPNLEITNNKTRSVVIFDPVFKDELITFTGAATLLAATLLARDSVSLKLVPYVKGGTTNENGIPKAMITQDVEAAGAGDIAVRAMVQGRVRAGDLVIDADGDASNIDDAVLDELRDYGIVGLSTTQLAQLDNQ